MTSDDVRERQMTSERPLGGLITACRMEERDDGRFVTYFTLNWLPGERLFVVQKSPKGKPRMRVWANATLGLRYIRHDLWYDGLVTFSTTRRRLLEDAPSWVRHHGDTSFRAHP